MLALEDLKSYSEDEVLKHLVGNYTADPDILDKYEVVIAYESVGDWGCDSSSFFLLKDKETGELFEVHGSHCSCYGFEDQFSPEATTLEALLYRVNEGYVFGTGGYDGNADYNRDIVNNYIKNLCKTVG